jgi:hypothetical protein
MGANAASPNSGAQNELREVPCALGDMPRVIEFSAFYHQTYFRVAYVSPSSQSTAEPKIHIALQKIASTFSAFKERKIG